MLKMIFSIYFFLFTQIMANQDAIKFSDEKWGFYNLRSAKLLFNLSSNYYGMVEQEVGGHFENSFEFYGVDYGNHPNLDIHFYLDQDHTLTCKYRVYTDPTSMGIREWKGIWKGLSEKFNAKNDFWATNLYELLVSAEGNKSPYIRTYGEDEYIMHEMEGGGKFNDVVEEPQCLYELYRVVMERSEYELLRYCAKGYFYRGFDFDDPRARWMRKNWVLYLMEGRLQCNVSDMTNTNKAFESNRDLLDKGYKLEMLQQNPAPSCDEEFVLSQFTDNSKEANFMMAAIVGSAKSKQFSGDWQCKSSNSFKLRVGHYCTRAKEYESITFDLSFSSEMLATEGVQEDRDVQILLDHGLIRFGSDYLRCNEGKKDCAEVKKKVQTVLNLKSHENEDAELPQKRILLEENVDNSTSNSTKEQLEMDPLFLANFTGDAVAEMLLLNETSNDDGNFTMSNENFTTI